MKNELKSKAASPAPKRAPKSASKSKKTAAKSTATGAETKKARTKAKAPVAKIKKAKAEPTAKLAQKRASKGEKPKAEAKAPDTRPRKAKAKTEVAAGYRVGDPVVDPIGDTNDGEGRTYTGAEAAAAAETETVETGTAARDLDAVLEAGPGLAAAAARAASEGGAGEPADEHAAPGAVAEDGAKAGAELRPPAKLERLQKILSQAGIASRRRAEEMIVAGRVMVNGQVVTQLGSKADPARDHIRVDGKLLHGAERHRYFLLNKPRGYVTTVSDPEGRPTVMEFFVNMGERLYPVGRLDYLSEGLLLMTNDGELANLLSKAGSGVEKTYLVKVAGQPNEEELERLRGGVEIERGEAGTGKVRTAPARIRQVREGDNPWFEVVLIEGRNRELRKMFADIGHFAEKIRRVGYGPLVLDVEPGKMRELTLEEVSALRLTAEGKLKPRRAKMAPMLSKEAGQAAAESFERPTGQRREKAAGKPFDRTPDRGGKPFQRREGRPQKPEWRPREGEFRGGRESGAFKSGEKTGFGKRPGAPFGGHRPFAGAQRPFGGGQAASGPKRGFERPGSERNAGKPEGFGGQSRPKFGARPPFPGGQRPFAGGQRPFGGERPSSGPKPGYERPVPERPRFERPGFAGKPRGKAEGRFEDAPRKPFPTHGERPYFKRREEPKRRFDNAPGKGFDKGSGKSWTQRPDRRRNEEPRSGAGGPQRSAGAFRGKGWAGKGAQSGAGRPKPAFGSRPGNFARPNKPGGAKRGGPRFDRKRPDGR